jgi:glycosyltransferase involved in cell wall biosynthesis
MVLVSGMERMTFEVLSALRQQGATVHCILNRWENHRIRELAEAIGATWSTGYYWYRFDRHARNPLKLLQFSWDILCTSFGLLRDARRIRATHVLIPEFASVLRNAPALLLLRVVGIPVFLRLANAPDRGRFYDLLWRHVLPAFVTKMVCNSEFAYSRCRTVGVHPRKLALIRNRVAARPSDGESDSDVLDLVRSHPTLLSVGQIAPFKGTHVAVGAVLDLLDEGRDLQLVVVGPSPEWPPERVDYFRELVEKVRERKREARVHFVGARSNVLRIMEKSTLLLAPILQEETFGNVVLEARSVGLPVVAFPRGGIPELVEHEKTGFLCRSLDRAGLREGILFFLDQPETWHRARRLSPSIVHDPGSPYSSEAFARSWGNLFARNGNLKPEDSGCANQRGSAQVQ